MRIAIDARELQGQPTGVGRYLSEILAAWKELPEAAAHEIVLCRADGSSAGTIWEQLTLPRLVRRAGADVLFAPAYTGPLRGRVPMVVAIHDVSFAAHPAWFPPREGLRRRVVTKMSAHRATRVLTISEFSKQEIVRYLGVLPGKVEVIYPGVSRTVTSSHPTVTPPHPRTVAPSVLYVGSVFTRRHVPELIDAFARIARQHPDARLEVVGDNRTTPHVDLEQLARESGADSRIHLRSYVTDAELAALYQGARAFAFLSDYEGFGFTPLEALAAGVPIVVLDTAVAREIYGPAAIYVDRPDGAAIERALERALFDDEARARVLTAAREVLARYSWRESARRTLDALVACGR